MSQTFFHVVGKPATALASVEHHLAKLRVAQEQLADLKRLSEDLERAKTTLPEILQAHAAQASGVQQFSNELDTLE